MLRILYLEFEPKTGSTMETLGRILLFRLLGLRSGGFPAPRHPGVWVHCCFGFGLYRGEVGGFGVLEMEGIRLCFCWFSTITLRVHVLI